MSKLNSLIFRRATEEDASTLARIHVAAWIQAYMGIVPDDYLLQIKFEDRLQYFQNALSIDSEDTYVAQQNKQLVGFVTLGSCRDVDVDKTVVGEIWGLYVDPKYWRHGIGNFLCNQSTTILASWGYSHIKLWVLEKNLQAQKFYSSMGFIPEGIRKSICLGCNLDVLRYQNSP